MVKKKYEEMAMPFSSSLIKSPDEVRKLLEAQITAADAILEMQVARENSPYSYDMFGAPRSGRNTYNKAQEEEFLRQYHVWDNRNKEIFTRAFEHPNNMDLNGYVESGRTFFISDVVEELKKIIKDQVSFMKGFIGRLDLIPFTGNVAVPVSPKKSTNTKKIFVVHGHDTNTRNEVELFVRSIGYEPIILCKRADKGDTIIEKIEREAKDVCFAIVIYTSCDLGKDKNEVDLKPRARQNVVFEHGYMCARLGRPHVCALLEEGVEQPGDLKGVIYKPLDSAGVWKYLIADEMKAVGLEVDKNKI